MRPIRRGVSPQAQDFQDYRDALPDLVSRLGSYCSYCERLIVSAIAVEHIQPKGLQQYAHLIGHWRNLLLACVNCNSTKGDRDVNLAETLLPDRDNTFAAFVYDQDGTVRPATLAPDLQQMAANTLALTGLDKRGSSVFDENGKLVAIDRVAQRMEAWLQAQMARADVEANPGNVAVRRLTVSLAQQTGFFSIWMAVFGQDLDMRNRLIDAFGAARASGCCDELTSQPFSPAPNPDGLMSGGKI